MVPFQPPEAAAQSKDETTGSEEAVSEHKKLLPHEELAASIFQFMKVAGTLGSTLTSVADEQAQEEGNQLRRSDAASSASECATPRVPKRDRTETASCLTDASASLKAVIT